MKFEIIFLGLILLLAKADYIYAYNSPLQLLPGASYASSYYMPTQTTLSSFTKTTPILQSTLPIMQSAIAPSPIQTQNYIQPMNTLTSSTTRSALIQGASLFSTSSSSYSSYPTSIQAPTLSINPTPTPISAPTPTPTPTLIPTANYISSFAPTDSIQLTTISLAQPLQTQVINSSSLTVSIPDYSTTSNAMLGTNNAITGSNNSGSGSNNLISGTNNCLNGDNNMLLGASNTITGSSNTVMGDQNCVTGSSNTVMGLSNTLATSNNLVIGSGDIITCGTLPPSPVDSTLLV